MVYNKKNFMKMKSKKNVGSQVFFARHATVVSADAGDARTSL